MPQLRHSRYLYLILISIFIFISYLYLSLYLYIYLAYVIGALPEHAGVGFEDQTLIGCGTLAWHVSNDLCMAKAGAERPRYKISRQQHRCVKPHIGERIGRQIQANTWTDRYTCRQTGRQTQQTDTSDGRTDGQTDRQTALTQTALTKYTGRQQNHTAPVPDWTTLANGSMESAECKATHSSGLPFAQVGWIQVLRTIHAPPQQRRGHLIVQGGRIPIICLIYPLPLLVPPITIGCASVLFCSTTHIKVACE